MVATLHIIYASTSGHTEFAVTVLRDFLVEADRALQVTLTKAERAKPADLLRGDAVILACGTWNTGSVEGQLSPHMYRLLIDQAATLDLQGKPMAAIGLGDQRYRYRVKAADGLEDFITSHAGRLVAPALRIVNEPFGQEDSICTWATSLLTALKMLP